MANQQKYEAESDSYILRNIKGKKDICKQNKLYILWGPPASGKSSVISHIIEKYHKDCEYFHVNVDDITLDVYKIIAKSQDEQVKLDQNQYWLLRDISDDISDVVFKKILQKKIIVFWETTGKNNDEYWINNNYIKMAKDMGYEVILSVPFVSIDNLLERCNKRDQAANCDQGNIETNAKLSLNNLKTVLFDINNIIVFDNDTSLVEVYNSITNENSNVIQGLESAFELYNKLNNTNLNMKGGKSDIKHELPGLYKCNDGRLRKAFTINKRKTIYVMVKGIRTRVLDIPKKKNKN